MRKSKVIRGGVVVKDTVFHLGRGQSLVVVVAGFFTSGGGNADFVDSTGYLYPVFVKPDERMAPELDVKTACLVPPRRSRRQCGCRFH